MAFKKDPDAILDYTFDWAPYLTPIGDVIASVTWVLTAGLTKVSQSNTANTATVFVSGGVPDTTETITCRITTVGNGPGATRTDDRSIPLKIVNR